LEGRNWERFWSHLVWRRQREAVEEHPHDRKPDPHIAILDLLTWGSGGSGCASFYSVLVAHPLSAHLFHGSDPHASVGAHERRRGGSRSGLGRVDGTDARPGRREARRRPRGARLRSEPRPRDDAAPTAA